MKLPEDLRPTACELATADHWVAVRDDAARLRIATARYDAAALVGLLADEVTLTSEDTWPSDVAEAAQRLGLFDRYSPTTLHGVVAHLSANKQLGLTNDIKGTVFEVHVVDQINAGQVHLDGVDHARLAADLHQPGWDAELLSKSGEVVGHVQMKATEWPGVAEHLQRYPQYPDVITTTENAKYAQAHEVAGHITDIGESHDVVTAHVQDVVDHIDAAHALHELVPEIALAAILAAAAIRLRDGEDKAVVGRWVRDQAGIAGLANLAALTAQVATGTVAIRPAVSIGTRFAIARAQTGRVVARKIAEIHDTLRDTRAQFGVGLRGED